MTQSNTHRSRAGWHTGRHTRFVPRLPAALRSQHRHPWIQHHGESHPITGLDTQQDRTNIYTNRHPDTGMHTQICTEDNSEAPTQARIPLRDH